MGIIAHNAVQINQKPATGTTWMVCARGVLISTWFVVTPVTVKESPRTPLAAVQLGIVVPAASLVYRVLQVAANGTGRPRCLT